MPQAALTKIKHYLLADFPVRIDAPDRVSLFAYGNATIAVGSFRNAAAAVNAIVPGEGAKLRDLKTGHLIAAKAPLATEFAISLEAHSWRTYRIEH